MNMTRIRNCEQILVLSEANSRYGQAKFAVHENSFTIMNGGKTVEHDSINPSVQAKMIYEEFLHKDKPRVYCNKLLADAIPINFKYFFVEEEYVFFHDNAKAYRTNGAIIRSGNNVELSFFMPHALMKKRQIMRFHLIELGRSEVYVQFKISFTEKVTWPTRNLRSTTPCITIG